MEEMEKRHLHILWTSPHSETARMMVLMYARNSLLRGWWDKVTVILWGASARLAAEDVEVQTAMALAAQTGVEFTACIACARELGVLADLERLGIDVRPWGEPLTELIDSGRPLLTV